MKKKSPPMKRLLGAAWFALSLAGCADPVTELHETLDRRVAAMPFQRLNHMWAIFDPVPIRVDDWMIQAGSQGFRVKFAMAHRSGSPVDKVGHFGRIMTWHTVWFQTGFNDRFQFLKLGLGFGTTGKLKWITT